MPSSEWVCTVNVQWCAYLLVQVICSCYSYPTLKKPLLLTENKQYLVWKPKTSAFRRWTNDALPSWLGDRLTFCIQSRKSGHITPRVMPCPHLSGTYTGLLTWKLNLAAFIWDFVCFYSRNCTFLIWARVLGTYCLNQNLCTPLYYVFSFVHNSVVASRHHAHWQWV